jgi:hypothetical protein
VLQKVQEESGYLPREVIPEIARILCLSEREVYEVDLRSSVYEKRCRLSSDIDNRSQPLLFQHFVRRILIPVANPDAGLSENQICAFGIEKNNGKT